MHPIQHTSFPTTFRAHLTLPFSGRLVRRTAWTLRADVSARAFGEDIGMEPRGNECKTSTLVFCQGVPLLLHLAGSAYLKNLPSQPIIAAQDWPRGAVCLGQRDFQLGAQNLEA